MRKVVTAVVVGSLFGLATVGGCGGTSSTTDAGTDATSSPDVTTKETGADAIVEAGCSTDANITNLPLPDAALNDAGATVPGCAMCLNTNCKADIADCQDNCECREAVVSFYNCVGMGGSLIGCATNLLGLQGQEAQQIGQSLLVCVNAFCRTQCGVPSFGDGGPQDASGQ